MLMKEMRGDDRLSKNRLSKNIETQDLTLKWEQIGQKRENKHKDYKNIPL